MRADGGRVALLAGAAGGIGRSTAIALAETGHRLVLADRDEASLASTAEAVRAARPAVELCTVTADLTVDSAVDGLLTTTLATFGQLDVLVNSVGVLDDARLEKMSDEQFDRVLRINLLAPLLLVGAALPALCDSGAGRVILLASRAWLGAYGSTNYSAAKGGLVGAVRALALRWAAAGVTVNCVAPGFIETPMTDAFPPDIRARVIESIPVGRPGSPHDVARTIAFLADAAAGYITGQTLLVCGGRSIGTPISARR